MSSFRKDPGETDYFEIDFSRDLDTGEGIASVTWTLDSGITNSSTTETSTVATIYLSGGTDGNIYKATCAALTDLAPSGRTLEKTIFIEVSPK